MADFSRARRPHVHRRQVRGGALGRALRERESRHRGGDRRGRRRRRRGDAGGDRGRAPRLRHHVAGRTDIALRKRCLEQLREGLEKEKEHLRKQTIAEVGAPMLLTYGPQGDSVITDLALGDGAARPLRLGARPRRARVLRHEEPAPGAQGADRRDRLHHAVELPAPGEPREGRARAGGRQHDRAEAGAGHAVERDLHREGRRGAHRHPARRLQRGDVARPGAGRRAAVRAIRASTCSRSPARRRSAAASWPPAPRR